MFFDYDQDLAVFESLMQHIDDDKNLLEAEEESTDQSGTEPAAEEPAPATENSPANDAPAPDKDAGDEESGNGAKQSEEKRVKGSVLAAAISKAVELQPIPKDLDEKEKQKLLKANEKVLKVRTSLFRNAYASPLRVFNLAEDSGFTIKDNRNAKDYFAQNDKTIIVNFSELVRRCTSKKFDTMIKATSSWQELTDPKLNSPFDEAIRKALKTLENIIDNGTFGVDAPENQKGYKKPKTDDKLGQSVPPDGQTPVEPPPDVEPPADEDQRAIYQQILKDFRDTYQMQLEADCDAKKHELTSNGVDGEDDRDPDEEDPNAGIRDDLINGCYQPLMQPYLDKADDDTQEKVKRVVAFYVDKYLGTPENGDKKDAGDGDGIDDKSGKNEEQDELKKPDGGSWYANTMLDMKNKDYHNHQLYVNPKLQDHGKSYNDYKAYYEKKKAKKKAEKEQAKAEKNAEKEGKQPSKTLSQPKQQPKKDEMDWS